jgi:hypothetical protein
MNNRQPARALLTLALLATACLPPPGKEADPSVTTSSLVSGDAGRKVVWLVMRDQADLSGAASIRSWRDRGQLVHDRLKAAAARSQPAVRAMVAAGSADIRSFWIVNALRVDADAAVIDVLSRHPAVARVMPDQVFSIPPVTADTSPPRVDGVEWGLASIHAPAVWSTLGARGEGIVIANIDTGVQFDHPALVRQYRGNQGSGTFDHNYNWFDPAHICAGTAPCDNNDHGTHTMGTMVGDDGDPGANQIGVAPHARWIAAKGCESNSCSLASLLSAGQWVLAPTDLSGQNPRPELRPDVVNNSWGGASNDPFYRATVQAWVAAGIFPAFSNGNAGPACATSGSPGDYPESYSAGAHDVANAIASFSSRGASAIDGGFKPNIAAPGVGVRSSVRGGNYLSFNGTSMASPHVAGSVALLWSLAPLLRGDVAATRALLDQSALDTSDASCGGTAADNNVWGEGRLDVLAAAQLAPRGPTGTLQGLITRSEGAALAGASLLAHGPVDRSAVTAADGTYSLILPTGSYQLTARASGRIDGVAAVTISEGATTTQDFALEVAPSFLVSGTVRDAAGAPVVGRTVRAGAASAVTSPGGSYSLQLPAGSYTLIIDAAGCEAGQSLPVDLDRDRVVDFTLAARHDQFGYRCSAVPFAFVDAATVLPLAGDDASVSVSLPFSFSWYGSYRGSARVSTNGFVTFGAGGPEPTNGALPSTTSPNGAFYPFWDDLVIDGASSVRTQLLGAAPDRRFVIEWRDALIKGSAPAARVRFEVILSEHGWLEAHYHSAGPDPRQRGSSATVGTENDLGTDGLQFSFNQAVLGSSTAVHYAAPDGPPRAFINHPTPGAFIARTDTIFVDASDDVGVVRVDFLLDSTVIGSSSTYPYSLAVDFSLYPEGPHQITARAIDTAGQTGSGSTPITIDYTKPVLHIISPPSGTVVSGPITIDVNATDNFGFFSVDLWVDGSPRQSRFAPPWTFTLDPASLSAGTHFLVIAGTDRAFNFGDNITDWHTIVVDRAAPVAAITAPAQGTVVADTVNVNVSASDDAGVSRVEMLVDGQLWSTAWYAPYNFSLSIGPLASGPRQLQARAVDLAGRITLSTPVTVLHDRTAPVVAITAPAAGDVRGVLVVTAEASDDVGVSQVELLLDGVVQGSASSAPYQFSLDTAALVQGPHRLEAAAMDGVGRRTVSGAVDVIFDNIPPGISFLAPEAGATVSGTAPVTIEGSDGETALVSVEILVDGQSRATLTASPYTWQWDTTAETTGVHQLAARAVDRAGNQANLAQEVTVAPPYQYTWLEAEKGTLTSPMTTSNEGTASGARFIAVASGNNSPNSAPSGGRARYAFTATKAGSYRVWARVSAPSTSDDSFWVRVDGGAFIKWNDIANGVAWHWDSVHDSDRMNQPVSFTLAAGTHQLELAYREDGTGLDRLLITNDPQFDPTGHEPAPALPVVTDLLATPGTGRITLAWTAVPGAARYDVWRATSPGGLFPRLVTSTTAASAVDGSLPAGTPYCYVVDARTDAAVAPPSLAACATTPSYLYREAESGTIGAPLRILNDKSASGGKYLTVAAGKNSLDVPPSNGRASYAFTVAAAGSYRLWGRVIAPTTADDSFWVRIDGGNWVKWSSVALGASWHWDQVRDGDHGNAPVVAAGSHTVQVAYREDGTQLDRLLLTDDASFVPAGMGP